MSVWILVLATLSDPAIQVGPFYSEQSCRKAEAVFNTKYAYKPATCIEISMPEKKP